MLSCIATIKYNIALIVNSILTIQPVHESHLRGVQIMQAVFSEVNYIEKKSSNGRVNLVNLGHLR